MTETTTKILKGPITLDTVVTLIEKSFLAGAKRAGRKNRKVDVKYGQARRDLTSVSQLYTSVIHTHAAEYEAKRQELEATLYMTADNYNNLFEVVVVNKTKMEDIANGQLIPAIRNEYVVAIIADTYWDLARTLLPHLESVLDQAQDRLSEAYPTNTIKIELG